MRPVVNDHSDGGGTRLGDGFALGPKYRVSEESNPVNCHTIQCRSWIRSCKGSR